MKLGLVPDMHIKNDSKHSTYIRDTCDLTQEVFDKVGVEHVVHLGDLSDNPYYKSYLEYSTFNYYLDTFSKYKNQILIGNHDILTEGTLEYSPLKPLMFSSNFKIVDKYMVLMLGSCKIGLLPYSGKLPENEETAVLLHHLEVKGMSFPSGKLMDSSSSLIPDLIMSNKIIGGHVHLYAEKGKCVYTGLSVLSKKDYIFNYSDDQLPGIFVLDTDTLNLEKTINPHSLISLRYSDDKTVDDIAKDLNKIYNYNSDREVYIRYMYNPIGSFDTTLIEKTLRKIFNDKTFSIEFFKKLSISVLAEESQEENPSVDSEKASKSLEKKIEEFLKKKNPQLLEVFNRIK